MKVIYDTKQRVDSTHRELIWLNAVMLARSSELYVYTPRQCCPFMYPSVKHVDYSFLGVGGRVDVSRSVTVLACWCKVSSLCVLFFDGAITHIENY